MIFAHIRQLAGAARTTRRTTSGDHRYYGYTYLCGDRDVDILSTANTARYLGPSLGLES